MTGLRPGRDFPIIDVHTHLYPERLFAAVRAWFDERGWHCRYPTGPDEVAAELRARGVERFWFFNYAHKAGMARELNRWNAGTAARLPGAVALGTVHPADDDLLAIAGEAVDRLGLPGFKLHLDVQRFAIDDPRLDAFLAFVEERGRVLVVHGGTAASFFDRSLVGIAPFRRALRRHPRLLVIAAHMGAYEVTEFLALTGEYEGVHLDTCFCFRVDHGPLPPFSCAVDYDIDALSAARDRILFGSDFPNIPFDWEMEVNELLRLDLDEAFYRRVFHENARALMARLGC